MTDPESGRPYNIWIRTTLAENYSRQFIVADPNPDPNPPDPDPPDLRVLGLLDPDLSIIRQK